MSDEEQSTCGECGSDMTPVRPGKWQCDVCESRDFVRREQAKALRHFADNFTKCVSRDAIREYAAAIERGEIEVTP